VFGGEIKRIYRALLLSPVEFEAVSCYKATKGRIGTDDATLCEVICSKTPSELKQLKETYWRLYTRELMSQVKSDTGGAFEKDYSDLLVKLLSGKRDKPGEVDMSLVESDANVLYKAGEGKFFGTDKTKFTDILSKRSFEHLRLVFKAYEGVSKKGTTFERAVRKSVSGAFRKALLIITLVASGDQERLDRYYAERLYKSMKGLGTRDSVLVRELVTVRSRHFPRCLCCVCATTGRVLFCSACP
jgi:Annexin